MTADSNLSPYAPDVIPPYKGRPDRNCPVCGEPEDKPHTPDCEYAVLDYLHMPGMENSRLNAMDWRFNGIEERLGTVESNASAFRLTALEERLLALDSMPRRGIRMYQLEGYSAPEALLFQVSRTPMSK